MKKYSLSAIIAAGLLAGAASSASAADLGGNCCADLEERIAELEATTARKGNRKVSLTISGWVAEQVMWWDDGAESNAYVTGLGSTLASHFALSGSATIRPGLKAGYTMVIEVDTADPLAALSQTNDDTGVGVNVQQSYWYLKDDKLGQVSVGQLSPVSDNTAILVDGSGSLVPANWVLFDNNAFTVRINGALAGFTWGDVGHCNTRGLGGLGAAGDCGGGAGPGNYVRYDSPSILGFVVSADWGEDDAWDVGVKWAGEVGGFKLAAAASYYQTNEVKRTAANNMNEVSYYQVGAYVQHVATGLFVYGAYGHEDTDFTAAFNTANPNAVDSSDTWYVKAGLRQKLTPFGHTVLYGEYGNKDDTIDYGTFATNANGSQLTQWGFGVVQEIDAAAMSVFLAYRNYDAEFTCAVACTAGGAVAGTSTTWNADNMQIVKFGALINF